ncbi:MAG: hypothetical protein ABSB12_03300 [Candidatus Saccharimonadales bacterium]|jgi:hypothetical protein
MDSLSSILKQSDWQEPEVIAKIKAYVDKTFQAEVSVSVKPSSIIISAPSASLINALRLRLPELQDVIKSETNKNLVFRINP